MLRSSGAAALARHPTSRPSLRAEDPGRVSRRTAPSSSASFCPPPLPPPLQRDRARLDVRVRRAPHRTSVPPSGDGGRGFECAENLAGLLSSAWSSNFLSWAPSACQLLRVPLSALLPCATSFVRAPFPCSFSSVSGSAATSPSPLLSSASASSSKSSTSLATDCAACSPSLSSLSRPSSKSGAYSASESVTSVRASLTRRLRSSTSLLRLLLLLRSRCWLEVACWTPRSRFASSLLWSPPSLSRSS
mmetsp:Transcript_19595/g.62862  ORF Transcript_19595/g.62862 Transcript_19595/m.62862 type:complete len:247 (-) Transcript_19595:1279-2019(-)